MPIEINGEKISLHDIKDTDIHFVHTFLNKSGCKAAVMIYVDDKYNVDSCGVYRTKKGLCTLDERVKIILT